MKRTFERPDGPATKAAYGIANPKGVLPDEMRGNQDRAVYAAEKPDSSLCDFRAYNFAKAIRVGLSMKDMNQDDLAIRLGVSSSFVSRLCTGKKEPTLDILIHISVVFGINLSGLIIAAEDL